MGIEVNGTAVETDEEGYLVNLSDWTEDIAGEIAKSENVEMSPNHWEVVNFLRQYYDEYQIAPRSRPARSPACPSPPAASSTLRHRPPTAATTMSALAIFYALLFYAATLMLVGGLAVKIRSYAKTPAPLLGSYKLFGSMPWVFNSANITLE